MAEPFRIRPSSPADIAALVELEQASFSDPWTADQLAGSLAMARVIACVAQGADGAIVGHLIGRIVVDQGEILSLATDPARRREGIARGLLDEALEQMRSEAVESVWLEVRDSNTAAQHLYAARGFVTAGRRRGYYRQPLEDALILRCDLGVALQGAPVPSDRP